MATQILLLTKDQIVEKLNSLRISPDQYRKQARVTPINEGGALPTEMDLDGSTFKDQIFNLKNFSFTNPQGGTGQSNWEWDKQFQGVAQVRVTKDWEDYETGHRFIGEALSPDLVAYISEVGHLEDRRIFFSEFGIQKPELNAHARKMARKSPKSSLGKHMAAFRRGDILEVDSKELF